MLEDFPVDMLLDIAAASGVYPKAMRLEAARLIKSRTPANRFSTAQAGNVVAAKKAGAATANHESLAAVSSAEFHKQFDRKVALRMENDSEFAAIMNCTENV